MIYLQILKPALDFVFAALLLVLLAPLLAAIWVLVRLDSPGAAVFAQDRVGLGGKVFRVLKFRSMYVDARGPVLTQVGDTRVTRLGRLLRRTSIDELPQLINILRGEMSFVGPRPEVPSIVEEHYTAEQRGVLAIRPGLSGWAQLHGRDDLEIPVKLAYDLEYVRRISFGLDALIVLRTPLLLITGRGIK